METNNTFMEQIRQMAREEARKIATEVYTQLGTRYGVAKVPTHTHDGVDSVGLGASAIDQFEPLPATEGGVASPGILGSQTINESKQSSNTTIANKFSSTLVNVDPIPVVWGQGSGSLTTTATVPTGATGATLTTAYPYESGDRKTVFNNGNQDLRLVSFTKGGTHISWSEGLSQEVTSTILFIEDSPSSFAGGQAPVGTMLMFTNPAGGVYPNNGGTLWVRLNVDPNFSRAGFTLTGALTTGDVSATLTSNWTHITGVYYVILSGGQSVPATFVNGSATVSFENPLPASSTSSVIVSGELWYGFVPDTLLPI